MTDLEIYKEVLKTNQNIIIKRIYHISDIHINLRAKHDEYKQVFENLYQYLYLEKEKFNIPKDKNQDIECLIVITGDILHSKTELLPECIELTRDFLSKLSIIMPVVMMAGNHDLNINNSERLDGLTPIVNGIDKSLPVYYLKKTGLYQYYNIIWSLSSVQDYQIVNPSEIDNIFPQIKNQKNHKICLFHGRVNGAILFNNTKLDGETNKKNKKTITPSSFSGYDYTFLGDIHKFQYMKPNIAYAGSLIQQNHGETLNNHGVLVWNLENNKSRYQEIKNNYGYITFKISKKEKIESIKKRIILLSQGNTPHNIRLRLQINQISKTEIQEIQAIFKEYFNLLEVIYSDISQTENNINKEITLNITDVNYQNKLIEEYLMKSSNADPETITQVKKLNEIFNQTREENQFHLNTRWKLHKLEFSNLFSYGENNVISFRHFKGIVGIIAPNHMGKSSIIDIILFTLFDKFPRKGNIKDIINNRRRTFKTKLTITIGKWKYIVEKSGTKNEKNRVNCKLHFYRINKDSIKQILNEDTQSKTKEAILKYVGLYEDIIQTSISLQNNNCNFIEAENTARKKELERILQVNFIDQLAKKVNGEITGKRAIYKHLQDSCYPESIIKLQTNIKDLIQKLNHNNQEQIKYNQKLQKYEIDLEKIQSAIIPNIQEKMDKIKLDIGDNPKDKLRKLKKKSKSLEEDLERITKEERQKKIKLLKKSYNELEKIKKEQLQKHKSRKKKLTSEIKEIDNLLETKLQSLISYNLKENSKHSNLPEPKFNSKLDSEIKKLESQIKKERQTLKELDKFKTSIQDINQNSKNNNYKLIELNKKLGEHNQEELPEKLLEILEETNVIEIRDNFDEDIQKLNKITQKTKQTKQTKLNIEGFLENARTLFNYEYIEDYQTLNEINNQDKKATLKDINDIETQEKSFQKELKVIQNKINTKIKGLKGIKNIEDLINFYHLKIKDLSVRKGFFEKDKGIFNDNKLVYQEIEKIKKEKKGLEKEMENDIEWNNFEESYELYLEYRQIKTQLDEINLKDKAIQDKIQNYLEIERDYLENQKLIEKIKDIKSQISSVKESLKKNENEMNINKTLFTSNNTKLEEHKKEVQNMNKLEKELNLLSLYNNSLKNLPYIIIKQVVPKIEQKINDLLVVCTNFMIKIEIENNRIDIYIDRPVYQGSLILLNNASGFERFISSLAIRLALLDVSQLPKPNFIAIDEGWSSFDYQNINNVGLIFDYLNQKFDMVLSISHISQIKEHCTEQIQLKKDDNGFSKII